jgi:hypothetical protein
MRMQEEYFDSVTSRRLGVLSGHLVLQKDPKSTLQLKGVSGSNVDEGEQEPRASMKKERKNAIGFGEKEIREMTYLLDGGEEITKAKELAILMINRDPILRMERPFDMTLKEARDK